MGKRGVVEQEQRVCPLLSFVPGGGSYIIWRKVFKFTTSHIAPYEEVAGALVSLSKNTKALLDEAEEKEEAAREKQRIEK